MLFDFPILSTFKMRKKFEGQRDIVWQENFLGAKVFKKYLYSQHEAYVIFCWFPYCHNYDLKFVTKTYVQIQ